MKCHMLPTMKRGIWIVGAFILLSTPEITSAASAPAPVFKSVLPTLRRSHTPVYVPSWLPRFERTVYPRAFIGPRGRSFEIDLSYVAGSVGTATLAFYLTANMDALSPGPHASRVRLGGGVTGYIGSIPHTASDSLTIRWRRNGVVFAIGRLGSTAALIRCARSVVRVGG